MCERPDSGKHLIVRGSGYLDGNLSSGKNFILFSPQSRLLNKRLMAHLGKNLIVCEHTVVHGQLSSYLELGLYLISNTHSRQWSLNRLREYVV
jgi:hypothetical protein